LPISKGRPWGTPGPLPDDVVFVDSDAAARKTVESARRQGIACPPIALLGGDLCHTLGGDGDRSRLVGGAGVHFTVDLGQVLIDGRLHTFLAHVVAHSRLWRRAFVAMNGQWLGQWNLGPRAHPGDGLLDTYDVRLALGQLGPVRARLHHGTHLPHPGIRERRVATAEVVLETPLPVFLDGTPFGKARRLVVRVVPDALSIIA